MKVDRDRFLDEGYIIVDQLIPPGMLDDLRTRFEIMVERQRAIWAAESNEGDPPGGQWETDAQPRLMFGDLVPQIDRETAATIEFWTSDFIHDISSHLLNVTDAPLLGMMLMCNPARDHGVADHNGWHRDLYPPFSAPIQGWVDDIVESGPRYVQWNVPLYDDDVLWVMPGSHRRLNTEEENRRLMEEPRVPLPGAVQTRLKAGDGVAYITPILHWGSRYDRRKRRTIHGGYCLYSTYPEAGLLEHLSVSARRTFERWFGISERMQDVTEEALRAAIARDAAAYGEALEQLHPGRGDCGRKLTTVMLSKTARRINDLHTPDTVCPENSKSEARFVHPLTLDWGAGFGGRFDADEAATLWERFKPVDDLMFAATEMAPPGYADRPSRHCFYEMPEGLGTGTLTAGW
jgi:hypothetical protein